MQRALIMGYPPPTPSYRDRGGQHQLPPIHDAMAALDDARMSIRAPPSAGRVTVTLPPLPFQDRRASTFAGPSSYQPSADFKRPSLPSLQLHEVGHYQPHATSPMPSPGVGLGPTLRLPTPPYHGMIPPTHSATLVHRPQAIAKELSPQKAISKDNHKKSEKQRRDAGSVYVNFSSIIRGSASIGRLTNCTACINAAAESTTSPSTSPTLAATIESRPTKPAKDATRNDMLSEGTAWEFEGILHLAPALVPARLRELRRHAEQLLEDKRVGLRTCGSDRKKQRKFMDDVRAETAFQMLHDMCARCEEHGVEHGIDLEGLGTSSAADAERAAGTKRKRTAGHGRGATPPSSRGSPVSDSE